MSVPREVIVSVLNRGLTPEESADMLDEYSRRRRAIADRDKTVTRIKREADRQIEEVMAKAICDHEITKVHGDPSGGSDRSEECLICGELFSS